MKDWTLPLPRAAALAVLSMVAMLALVADASARSTVDLLNDANMRIDGAAAFDRAGFSVAGAGDVNGDGRPDVIVSAAFSSHNPLGDRGSGSGNEY